MAVDCIIVACHVALKRRAAILRSAGSSNFRLALDHPALLSCLPAPRTRCTRLSAGSIPAAETRTRRTRRAASTQTPGGLTLVWNNRRRWFVTCCSTCAQHEYMMSCTSSLLQILGVWGAHGLSHGAAPVLSTASSTSKWARRFKGIKFLVTRRVAQQQVGPNRRAPGTWCLPAPAALGRQAGTLAHQTRSCSYSSKSRSARLPRY